MKSSYSIFAAVAAASLLAIPGAAFASSPVETLRAALSTSGNEVATVEPKAFLAAVSAVLAGAPAAQVPAHAGAAVGLRPDLAGEVVHAAISALHLPGRLPEAALVAATVKAALAAAAAQKDVIVTRAVVDAPEAREDIFAASGVRTTAPVVTVASLSALPGSQVRLSDALVAPTGAVATTSTVTASAPVAEGAMNPANVSSPRRTRPNVSQN